MTQTINLTAGAVEYTWPLTITETTGKDITATTIRLCLGSYTAPGDTWLTPDTDTTDGTSSRVVQLLIGDELKPEAGNFWLWSKVTDAPETVPRRHGKVIIT